MRTTKFKTELLVALVFLAGSSCNDNDPEPVPVITHISRVSGIVGSAVTIIGDQFVPTVPPENGTGPFPNTSIVRFNGVEAEAEFVYQDAIRVQRINTSVPPGATSGKITITVNGISVSSENDFT
jgi:hypothetical protein